MVTRAALHELIDRLPEPALPAAERQLRRIEAEEEALPAVLRDAPLDDEEETDAERAAIAAADAEIAAGAPWLTTEDVKRELGL